jgi:putative transposase
MAEIFSQVNIHIILAVESQNQLIPEEHQEELSDVITRLILRRGHKPLMINGIKDHIHIFLGLKVGSAISVLVRDIKNGSANYMNRQPWIRDTFSWQPGFGAFSYAYSQVEDMKYYIMKQESLHKRITFREEFLSILDKFRVDYEEDGLFAWIESTDNAGLIPEENNS